MKTLIIAEKNSTKLKLQSMLETSFGQTWINKGDYLESQDYLISNFYGHLLEMLKPDSYSEKYKTWSIENLPILPDTFLFEYKKGQNERGHLLKKLSQQCGSIINATDPDREGEGIFRIWYNFENIGKPVRRIWMTSLTTTDLVKAWKAIKDSKHYDNLFFSQEARSQADWLVGMNASRLYTILTSDRCPVGRVKTATLALIVKRDQEVENYKESFTYSLTGTWSQYLFTYLDKEKAFKFDDKNYLENLIEKIKNDNFSVQDINKEQKLQFPPKTFSQPDLQRIASIKFGFSLNTTLQLTQQLYEKQLVTYPRSDSPYLPESDLVEYYKMINNFASKEQKNLLLPGTKPHCVKNTDASHTAIIPTGQIPEHLTVDELKLYELIKERFIVAFMKPKTYDQYTIIISNGEEQFRSIVKIVKDYGFQSLYNDNDDEEGQKEEGQEFSSIDETSLKSLQEPIKDLSVNPIKKTKPKYYTPDTLVAAMINCGRTLEDKESREIMSQVEGLGTSATRHLYPEELEKDGFIQTKGKYLISTVKGRKLIELIAPGLKSIEKTAEMEQKLRLIETGNYDFNTYRKEIDAFVNSFLAQAICQKQTIESSFVKNRPATPGMLKLANSIAKQKSDKSFNKKDSTFDYIKSYIDNNIPKNSNGSSEEKPVKKEIINEFECPCRKKGKVFEYESFYKCSCGKFVQKLIAGVQLTHDQVISLYKGDEIHLNGCKGKNGPFNPNLKFAKNGKTEFVFK